MRNFSQTILLTPLAAAALVASAPVSARDAEFGVHSDVAAIMPRSPSFPPPSSPGPPSPGMQRLGLRDEGGTAPDTTVQSADGYKPKDEYQPKDEYGYKEDKKEKKKEKLEKAAQAAVEVGLQVVQVAKELADMKKEHGKGGGYGYGNGGGGKGGGMGGYGYGKMVNSTVM